MGGWNGAICVASRAMIISGRSIWRAQEISESFKKGEQIETTWPMLLKKQGYETYSTGKWHISAKADTIFDHVARTLRGMPFDTPEGYDRPKFVGDSSWLPWDTIHGGFWKGGQHWSELVRDDALKFIDQASAKTDPFFMYIAFNAPHDPRQSPKKYMEMYPLQNVSVPETFLPIYPFAEEMGAGKKLRDERLAPFPRTHHAVQVNRQEYYAIITHLDKQIELINQKLREKGLLDNTYIIFSADHGLSVGEHGLLGKQNMYDHSVRVPFIISGPGVPKGKKIKADIYLQDVVPTTLELAGASKPSYINFNSTVPFWKAGKKESFYPAIYGAYRPDKQRMIRKGDYKLITYPETNVIRLFNIKNDPSEMNDLAMDENHKEMSLVLFEALQDLQKEMGDTLNLEGLKSQLIL